MKKITNLLSITLLSSLLACTGQVVGQNVNLNNNTKPSATPSPTSTIDPNVIKPSPSVTPTPNPLPSPSIISPSPLETTKPKDYSKITFSHNLSSVVSGYPIRFYQDFFYETIEEVKSTFNSLKEEKEYYDKTTLNNIKNYQTYPFDLPIEGYRLLQLDLIYSGGSKDQDYTVEIPEEFKNIVDVKNNNTVVGLKEGNAYIKVTSNKNKNIFKFINIEVQSKAKFARSHCYESCSATFNGKVLDLSGITVDGAKISAKAIDPDVTWEAEDQLTAGGVFVFRNAPVGAKVLITVTKDGWTTRQRTEVLKSNLTGDPLANKFDFSGEYAIQDEPEITSLKINGRLSTATGSDLTANLANIDNGNLEVEMTFSEPVRTDDVQNFFRIRNLANNFVINSDTVGITWTWSNNDQTVKFKTNKPILANKSIFVNLLKDQEKYIIEFTSPFRDKTDKETIKGKYIRFNPQNSGDFNIFSLRNDDDEPKLYSITATDGVNGSNDVIELKFSESMDVIGKKINSLELTAPLAPTNKTRSLKLYQTNNSNNKNATILGYSTVDNSLNLADFRTVFTITRLIPPISSNQALIPLNINNLNAGNLINGSSLISAKMIDSTSNILNTTSKVSIVRLEFPSTAFNKGDRVILALGRTILGKYEDKNNGIAAFSIEIDTSNITNASITDPAGNPMSTAASMSSNITVNDTQRTSIVQ